MNKFLLIVLFILISTSVQSEQAFSSLEEQMNSKEFNETGLGKLTPAELEALNNWIRSRSLVALDAPKPGSISTTSSATATTSATATSTAVSTASGNDSESDVRGFEVNRKKKMKREPIVTRLVGTFTGWDGQATFALENGMVWQQADKDKFYIKPISNPEITIKPGALGTWRLSVEGHNSRCKVKRIQ